ncbi:P-loop NTPase fold protein [Pseudomonas fuscovaginae UPB0736]|uniref:P-loop NTPase fold protein n=1 Tax=Pseudomonas asplenii TaxID=53407 RepID=UPI000287E2AD|nr:P-loop NTPase fold protein [Pseudomonas fuscovaginae]UUQ65405.1 P-loop NTPase fold protein [Pseudomonas fuscovaginae UPB0736]
MLKDDKGDPLKLSGYATQLGTSSFPHDPYSSPGEGEPSGPIIHLDSIQIATTHSDDPWAVGLDDQLDVADEAKAFARMAASKAFVPPLAVGIFGDWGSGKSFFMRLVHEHIERLCAGLPQSGASEAGSPDFHTQIVQIRFNAWHYAETNLWASLVNHLFTELDRWYGEHNPGSPDGLLDTLSTARTLTLEAAQELVDRRKEQRNAANDLQLAEQQLTDAREALGTSPRFYWNVLTSVISEAKPGSDLAKSEEQLKRAAQELGMTDLVGSADSLRQVMTDLENESRRAGLLARGWKRQLQGWPFVISTMLVILFAPVVATYGQKLLANWLPTLGSLHQAIISVSVGLASISGLMGLFLAKTRKILGRLEAAKSVMDRAVDGRLSAQADTLKRTQESLSQANAHVEEAQARVKASSERLAEASHNYSQGTGASRLKTFVRARAVDGDYAKHLGLIETIRKDFEELSSCVMADGRSDERVQQEREAFGKRLQQFLGDHEGLLTDGEVSELKRTLTHLSNDKGSGGEEPESFKRIVLYIDDLDRCPPEKVVDVLQAVHLLLTFPIFVVMVAVDARWVRNALLKVYPGLIGTAGDTAEKMASANDYLEKIFQIPYWMSPMKGYASVNFLADHVQRLDPRPAAAVPEKALIKLPIDRLSITPEEEAFLKQLAPFLGGSPRRALRFLNTYRLIKASLSLRDLSKLEGGRFRHLLVLLALATASPAIFSKSATLLEMNDNGGTLESLIAQVIDGQKDSPELQRGKRILSAYQNEFPSGQAISLSGLGRYVSIARRYSFAGWS